MDFLRPLDPLSGTPGATGATSGFYGFFGGGLFDTASTRATGASCCAGMAGNQATAACCPATGAGTDAAFKALEKINLQLLKMLFRLMKGKGAGKGRKKDKGDKAKDTQLA